MTTTDFPVRLEHLEKSYGSGAKRVEAVRDVSLQIAHGEVVAMLGPNGAGKSTTIDLLLGLATPQGGTVQLFGTTPRHAIAAGRVGAMLQSGGILPDATVAELVGLVAALHLRPLSGAEAMARAEIADLAGRRFSTLSGGQQQRVRFAMAIVPDPDLIVLDEPTTGMDIESRRTFWRSMHAETERGRTVLFATHYLEEADEYADRVILLRAGQIIADGTSAQIKANVAGRTVRALISDPDGPALRELEGVTQLEVRTPQVMIRCNDSDTVLRYLLQHTDAHDIEVRAVGLEEAVLAMTDAAETDSASATAQRAGNNDLNNSTKVIA